MNLLCFLGTFLLFGMSFCWHWPRIDKCEDSQTWDLTSDGLQWEKKTEIMEFDYREWWFFTVLDEKTDFAMAFSYAFADPENIFGNAGSSLSVMIWENYTNYETAGTVQIHDDFKLEDFHATRDNATLSVGPNFIEVLDDKTYRMVAKSRDCSVSYDLVFQQAVPAMREEMSLKFIGELSWESYMPTAFASGKVIVNGVEHVVNKAVGYHDHNFGDWPNGIFNWVWSNYGVPEEGFAFTYGAYDLPIIKKYLGYIYFRYGDVRHKIGSLCGDEFEFEVKEWGHNELGKYSVHNAVTTYNKEWKIVIDSKMVANNLNPSGAGMGIQVFEQIAYYEVDLYRMEDGEWTLLKSFSGLGLDEWSNLAH